MRIEDPDRAALADQVFEQGDHRAFAQIVGVLFEGEPEDAEALGLQLEHGAHGPAQVRVITWQRRFQQRKTQVQAAGAIVQRPQIFRQAGAAERESGPEIGRRNVQDPVAAERIHHFAPGNSQARAERAYLIGESDLDRVECIAGVLDQLGGPQRNQARVDAQRRIQVRHALRRRAVAASHHQQRRRQELGDGAAFAQEFRIRDHRGSGSGHRRHDDVFAGSREYRAAHRDHIWLRRRPRRQCVTDFGHHPLQLLQAQVPIRL